MTERGELLVAGARVAGPATAIAFFLAWYLRELGRIERLEAFGIVLLGAAIGFAVGVLVGIGSRAAGERLVKTITASGASPPAASYSYEEALAIRGNPEAAREAYEARLHAEPGDVNARLALARLWRDQLNDPRKAEALYREARHGNPSPDQEFAIGNALIDLYRGNGEIGREMAELARFAERFAGTEAAAQARAALQRLKERSP